MLILIDADPIVYRCGFASEKTVYMVTYETPDSDELQQIMFEHDKEGTALDYLNDWLKYNAHHQITVVDKQKMANPDPLSHCLRTVKVQIESIIKECSDHYKTPDVKYRLYLSGGKNYRDKLATVRPYKGNRDPAHKPYHYQSIRDYLCARYGAIVTNSIEADDAVSIAVHANLEQGEPEQVVIATIDKDLDQIPGNHYNYMQKVFYAITNDEAERFFYYQILAGDITDNIVGCWRCGDLAAQRIVAEFSNNGRRISEPSAAGSGRSKSRLKRIAIQSSTAGEGSGFPDGISDAEGAGPTSRGDDSQAEGSAVATVQLLHARPKSAGRIWSRIVAEYANSQRKVGCPYAHDNPEAVAVEMARLVKLQEYPGQLWGPYGDEIVITGDFDE
jgi:hypothetical protein